MRIRLSALLLALLIGSLSGQACAGAASDSLTVSCPAYGFTITLPPDWQGSVVGCSAHTSVVAANRLSSVTVNVYRHAAITTARMQADLRSWPAPLGRSAGPLTYRNVKVAGVAFVTARAVFGPGPREQTAVYSEAYHGGRLYFIYGLAGNGPGNAKRSGYAKEMLSVLGALHLTIATGSAPPVTIGRTTIGSPLSRFRADLGAPSSYTPSFDLYSWRPCSATSHEVVEVRFSHGVAYRIALLNCSQVNLPNYLASVGTLLPEDAVPIGATISQNLGQLTLYYSEELHELLPAALRADPVSLHDCAGKSVAAGTLFVGQAGGTIAVGLGGCEAWPEAPRAATPRSA